MTFEQSLLIPASADYLFHLTQDYTRRALWDSFLRRAMPLDLRIEVGARVRCVAWHGLNMDVEYVSYRPPRVAAVKMLRGPWCLRALAGSWLFEAQGAEQTRVSFKYHVLARPAWLTPVAGRLLARDTRKRLLALKTYIEFKRQDLGAVNLTRFRE